MALTNLLRGALHGCKVRPIFGITSKISPISSAAYHQFLYREKPVYSEKKLLNNGLTWRIMSEVQRSAASAPKAESSHGDHAKIWTLERAISVGLLGILPTGIMFPNILFDLLMAVSIVMHSHWGVEAIAADYIRPTVFGPMIPKIAHIFVYLISIGVLVGLLNLIFNNAGLGNSIKLIWRI